MLSFALLFALATVSSAFTLPESIQSTGVSELSSLINGADCGFYAALNELYQCGPKSHLMQYSFKYCQLLVSVRDTFENTQYQDNARQCLQQKLFDQIQKATGAVTCDSFKKLDLDSHGSCLAVSFKQLSSSDVQKFLAVFKDTTVNYAQLCKMANGFAGHWSQIVKGDLMSFVKKQLKEIFPEGDLSACSIKEKEILEDIEDIISEVTKVVDTVKGIKDDIVLIIEKAKAIRDDYKAIQDTIKGIKNGTIPELDGVKAILERTKSIVNNAQTIIDTIKKLVKAKSGQSGEAVDKINRVLDDLISIIDQVESLKSEIYKVVDNVDAIRDIVDNIRDGKTDIFDGLIDIVNQVDSGVDNIYSILNTTYTIKETIVDLFNTVTKDLEGAVGDLIEGAGEKVDEIVGGATDAIGGATDAIGGALGGLGK